jgi:hypothetical protein
MLRPLKLAIMFNTEIRKHIKETSCHGFIIIDTANSSSWGLGSKQNRYALSIRARWHVRVKKSKQTYKRDVKEIRN